MRKIQARVAEIVINSSDDSWILKAREELLLKFKEDDIFKNKMNKIIKFCTKHKWDQDFRTNINICGVSINIGVLIKHKTLIMASDRFSHELTILKAYDSLNFQDEYYHSLKSIIEEVTSLDINNFPSITDVLTSSDDLPDLLKLHEENPQIDQNTFDLVKTLASYQNSYRPTFFEKLSDFALGLTASYSIMRVHLLKFIAILTGLEHDSRGTEVKRILLESLRRLLADNKMARKNNLTGQDKALPTWLMISIWISNKVFKFCPPSLLSTLIRFSVKFMAKRFIAGENIKEAIETMSDLALTNRSATLDQLGELVVSEKEADIYFNHVIDLINGLSQAYPNGEKNKSGINIAHVSIKVSALCSNFKPHAFDYTYRLTSERLKTILLTAKEKQVFINIDAEHYSYRDMVFKIYRKILLETEELSDYQQTGIVIQAYLRDSHLHFQDVLELAQARSLNMPIRLVKGAYWDAETIEAKVHNFCAPQFLNKEETDIRFRQLIFKTLESGKDLTLAVASHNIHDHCWAESLKSILFKESPVIEHQCLHMTYEALSSGLSQMQWPTRNYVPVGNLLVGMAYLVRRIMENSSQVGILTIMRSHKNIQNYTGPIDQFLNNKQQNLIISDPQVTEVDSKFYPVSPFRPYLTDHMKRFLEAKVFDVKCEGEHVVHSNLSISRLGSIHFHSNLEVEEIIGQDFDQEFLNSPLERIIYTLRLQEKLLFNRMELSKLIMEEAGKSIMEAFADVDEAIDFINYYTRFYLDHLLLNKNYQAKGVIGIIAPWNFPIAIPTGMAIAPLICGNRVIFKSSEKTPLVGEALAQLAYESCIPKTCFYHVAGTGNDVGATLVNSDKVAGIVFTGSKKVGVEIYKKAKSKLIKHDNVVDMKLSISEMGGKNAIIVTNNCEIDETVSGILYSAFAHAGQKCSACSRVIVHETIKESFVERFTEAVRDLEVASADKLESFVNNIISSLDKERILKDIDACLLEAKDFDGKVLVDRSREDGLHQLAVGPVVIELPKARSLDKNSMSHKEMFAPVIHIISYSNLNEAISIFNSVDYALTGGVYCQSQDDIDYLVTKLEAGNLYINRPNTGARVAIEPFGGFKMSGTGPKAGGPDYLYQFLKAKNPADVAFDQCDLVGGSSFMYYNPRPSSLNVHQRHQQLRKILKEVHSRYEQLFNSVNELDKKKMIKLINWIDNHINKYRTLSDRKNFYTPGQQNFDNFSLTAKSVVFCVYSKKPSLKCFNYFMLSLLAGSGILIMCRTNESYSFWSSIVRILRKHGIDKDQVDIYLTNLENFHMACASSIFELQYIDANIEITEKILAKSITDNSLDGGHLKKIITEYDGHFYEDYLHILLDFVHVRSLAINVMRHGAPLELNI